jgi:hypothetical protein
MKTYKEVEKFIKKLVKKITGSNIKDLIIEIDDDYFGITDNEDVSISVGFAKDELVGNCGVTVIFNMYHIEGLRKNVSRKDLNLLFTACIHLIALQDRSHAVICSDSKRNNVIYNLDEEFALFGWEISKPFKTRDNQSTIKIFTLYK